MSSMSLSLTGIDRISYGVARFKNNLQPLELGYFNLKKEVSEDPDLRPLSDAILNTVLLYDVKALHRLRHCLNGTDDILDAIGDALSGVFPAEQVNKRNHVKPKVVAKGEAKSRLRELEQKYEMLSKHVKEFERLRELGKDVISRLRQRTGDLEERLSSTERWRKSCKAVCKVVSLAAILAPAPVELAAVGATAMQEIETWITSWLDERQKALEREKDLVLMMLRVDFDEVVELKSVRQSVNQLMNNHIDSIVKDVKCALNRSSSSSENERAAIRAQRKIQDARADRTITRLKNKADSYIVRKEKRAEEFLSGIVNTTSKDKYSMHSNFQLLSISVVIFFFFMRHFLRLRVKHCVLFLLLVIMVLMATPKFIVLLKMKPPNMAVSSATYDLLMTLNS